MKNPFTLNFGNKPSTYIDRTEEINRILSSFVYEESDEQAYIIEGARGTGKTVLLSSSKKQFETYKDWLVIELSSEKDMIHELAAELHAVPWLNPVLAEAKLDLSLLGIGVSISGGIKISSEEVAVKRMLKLVKKMKRKVFIAVDEVSNTKSMREFASLFSICFRDGLPVYLIMTGLYKNTNALIHSEGLTFLLRTPRINLGALNLASTTRTYAGIFSLSFESAKKMALFTKGYSYAFQVLGYLTWQLEDKSLIENDFAEYLRQIEDEFDRYLQSYVYLKMWSEISETDKKVLSVMSKYREKDIAKIRGHYSVEYPHDKPMTSNLFNTYRLRLLESGILKSESHGKLDFALPRFENFIDVYGTEL